MHDLLILGPFNNAFSTALVTKRRITIITATTQKGRSQYRRPRYESSWP